METEKKAIITVISKENDISKIKYSVNNLTKVGFNPNEIIVAIKKGYDAELKKYIKENKYQTFEYESLKEIYYNISQNVGFDYIAFLNEGDAYSENAREIIFNAIKQLFAHSKRI